MGNLNLLEQKPKDLLHDITIMYWELYRKLLYDYKLTQEELEGLKDITRRTHGMLLELGRLIAMYQENKKRRRHGQEVGKYPNY